MPIFNNALAGAAGSGGAEAYKIERSLRFNKDKASHLTKTQSVVGNRKTFTLSFWIKRGAFTSNTGRAIFYAGTNGQTQNRTGLLIGNAGFSGNGNSLVFGQDTAGAWQTMRETTALFRDHAAWAHIVVAVDTTIASPSSDRIKIYINGVLQDTFTTSNDPAQNFEFFVNNNGDHFIGKDPGGYVGSLDANIADFHLIDGQQLAATEFGEFDADTGVWNPIEFTGSYTTTGSTSGTLLNYNSNTSLPTYSNQDGGTSTPSALANAFDGNSSTYANMTYSNGKWTRANFAQPITNVTRIDVGWDGEGDVGYNGSVVNSTVGYNGSRQSLTLYNNSGSPITLNNIHMVSQPGNGVCRLYDITITTTTQSATELTYSGVPDGVNGFNLNFSTDNAVGRDATSNDTPLPCVDFDGNDHLQIAYHSDFNLGSSDFTIECYAKTTDTTTNYPSIVGRWKGQNEAHWDFRPVSTDANDNFFFIYHDGTSNNPVNSGTFIADGKWHHLAVARDGANLRMFVDGALAHTHNIGNATISNSTSVPLFLGWDQWGSSYYKGQTSNLRIVVGTALYTSAFTKPTTPLTNVTNTKLLCFQSDTSVETAAVTPNSLVIKSGDPEAASVADSDWTAVNIQRLSATNGNYLANLSISEGTATYYAQTRDEYLGSFNGSTVGAWDFARNSTSTITGKIDFPGGRTVNSSLELWIGESWSISGYGTYQKFVSINGGAFTEIGSSSTANGDAVTTWRTFAVPGGTLNSIEVRTATSYGGGWGRGFASAIRIDGEILTDDSLRLDDDVSKDSPTNYEADTGNDGGNYSVLNPLDHLGATFADGNLKVNLSNGNHLACGTMGMPYAPGKYYWEVTVNTAGSAVPVMIGMANVARDISDRTYQEEGWYYYGANGQAYHQGSGSNMGDSYGAGDVIGVAVDCGFGTQSITFYKNGVSQGTPYSYSHYNWYNDTVVPVINNPNSGGNVSVICNFGARPFSYTPPTGYGPLCTQTLPDSTIKNGSTEFLARTYNGDTTTSQSGFEFSPDFLWLKSRSNNDTHFLYDTVRGVQKHLSTTSTGGEGTQSGVTSFDSNGFSYGSWGPLKNSSMIAWAWDAGTSNTTVATNANGTGLPGADCVYRANTTAGFSIVRVASPTSTEARVHGLGKKPDLIICKSTGSADSWHTYHSSLGYTKYINLNGSGGATSSDQFGSQEPTSTYFYVKANTGSGANKSDGMIYYIWTAVEGYSAFGSYVGTGASPNFVYLGFRPAFVILKSTTANNWVISDSTRSPYNVSSEGLFPDQNSQEVDNASNYGIDFLSNGFALRTTGSYTATSNNASEGHTYIYGAWAENPLKISRAR